MAEQLLKVSQCFCPSSVGIRRQSANATPKRERLHKYLKTLVTNIPWVCFCCSRTRGKIQLSKLHTHAEVSFCWYYKFSVAQKEKEPYVFWFVCLFFWAMFLIGKETLNPFTLSLPSQKSLHTNLCIFAFIESFPETHFLNTPLWCVQL